MDLKALLGSNWQQLADEMKTPVAEEYVSRTKNANAYEIAAAAFILWGPLVIGGGAMMKPRIKKSFGEDSTRLFDDVTGDA